MVIVRAGTKRLPGLVHQAGLGSTGWDWSEAWTCVFSSTHSTTPARAQDPQNTQPSARQVKRQAKA